MKKYFMYAVLFLTASAGFLACNSGQNPLSLISPLSIDPPFTNMAIGCNADVIQNEKGGEILEVERMGKKRLAYEINDQRHGIYFVVTYKSEDEIIKELERQLTLDENSWRHITVRMDEALLRKIDKNIKSAAARAEARNNGDSRDDDD